jgi:hypothetical protein
VPARLTLKVPLWTAMLGTVSNEVMPIRKMRWCWSRGGSACIGTGRAWHVLNAALWPPRGIGPESAHETFVGVGVVSSWWTGSVAAPMMLAS